ncbi:UTRA domain-containing protein [Streptomyces sp. NPDC021622]|uniref:UTRA domain-containing protein n=1 Tax=Streptomyces sp. NPDC021622 TaxID=3155013 RepID=UPI0033C56998
MARGTLLEDPEVSLADIRGVLEGAAHGPLRRVETITARPCTAAEREVLALPRGVCLQRVIRTVIDGAGTVLELTDWRWSAEAYELTRGLKPGR